MSERKVLNKYYPPDFDPSQIPRSKIKRNKTFVIRLMAPCNMRCTTCGEYIYKGRKFNARKEDVDDMNHLGLRIYRFYIRCTACVSEIAFRTDPANTDYVLEAGATRNFEALSKAEKQEEERQRAHEQELKDNPMKLLEERTEASKNEMARMEALEELQEMSKRTVQVDYESMLHKYDRVREDEEQRQKDEDEAFVKSIFSKEGGSTTTKRIVDDDDSGDSSDEEFRRTKKIKVEKATDLLGSAKDEGKKKEAWEKSVGMMSSGGAKKGIAGLVVKKKGKASATTTTKESQPSTTGPSTSKASDSDPVASSSSSSKPSSSSTTPAQSTGLSLLGDYSDTDSD